MHIAPLVPLVGPPSRSSSPTSAPSTNSNARPTRAPDCLYEAGRDSEAFAKKTLESFHETLQNHIDHGLIINRESMDWIRCSTEPMLKNLPPEIAETQRRLINTTVNRADMTQRSFRRFQELPELQNEYALRYTDIRISVVDTPLSRITQRSYRFIQDLLERPDVLASNADDLWRRIRAERPQMDACYLVEVQTEMEKRLKPVWDSDYCLQIFNRAFKAHYLDKFYNDLDHGIVPLSLFSCRLLADLGYTAAQTETARRKVPGALTKIPASHPTLKDVSPDQLGMILETTILATLLSHLDHPRTGKTITPEQLGSLGGVMMVPLCEGALLKELFKIEPAVRKALLDQISDAECRQIADEELQALSPALALPALYDRVFSPHVRSWLPTLLLNNATEAIQMEFMKALMLSIKAAEGFVQNDLADAYRRALPRHVLQPLDLKVFLENTQTHKTSSFSQIEAGRQACLVDGVCWAVTAGSVASSSQELTLSPVTSEVRHQQAQMLTSIRTKNTPAYCAPEGFLDRHKVTEVRLVEPVNMIGPSTISTVSALLDRIGELFRNNILILRRSKGKLLVTASNNEGAHTFGVQLDPTRGVFGWSDANDGVRACGSYRRFRREFILGTRALYRFIHFVAHQYVPRGGGPKTVDAYRWLQ